MQDMERKHKELEEQFETMKRGIIETANKKQILMIQVFLEKT